MTGAVGLIVEVDRQKVEARKQAGLIDAQADTVDEALRALAIAQQGKQGFAIGLVGNAANVYPELVSRGIVPDLVTDLTAAHDARYGYVPAGLSLEEWAQQRESAPEQVMIRAKESMATQLRAMREMQKAGAVVFENGNNLRVQAESAGVTDAFEIPGFVERYLRPLFCRGIGPFRWIALSGEQEDAARLDALASSLFPERPDVADWLKLARSYAPVEGLPARSCWLGHGERSRMALAVNKLVACGELQAPVLFTRDHLDSAGMTHPFIGTERMKDGSDAVADWPLLDAMLLCSTGADLVAVHAGGGGYSGLMQSAGVSLVADGTPSAARRLRESLDADTGLGVVRYAEAGYELAAHAAEQMGIRRIIPQ
jgi:urocanate hydratase